VVVELARLGRGVELGEEAGEDLDGVRMSGGGLGGGDGGCYP
jgi:hypothetical protein